MPFCPKCNGIYNEGDATCPNCGFVIPIIGTNEVLTQVYEAPNAIWADTMKAELRKAGIPMTERFGSASEGGVVIAQETPIFSRIFVPQSRAAEARQVIASVVAPNPQQPHVPQPPYQTATTHSPRVSPRPHNGATILVLGILSIVFCPILVPIAWIMGNSDLQEMNSGKMDPMGRDMTNAGRVCGIVGTCILGFYTLIGILYILGIIAGLALFSSMRPGGM